MVVSLGPGKFYGNSLPRPRFYTDVKHNTERVDPPVPVLDPLLSWASEAHWSMGGLSFNRLRLQGRIEGSVKRLRAQRERQIRKQAKLSVSPTGKRSAGKKRAPGSPSPPPAPIANKRRRRYMSVIDEEDESEEEEVDEKVMVGDGDDDSDEEESSEKEEEPVRVVNKKPARKLYEEFDRVADKRRPEGSNGTGVGEVVPDLNMETTENDEAKASSKKGKKIGLGSGSGGGIRTSPRLAKAVDTGPSQRTRSSRRLMKRG